MPTTRANCLKRAHPPLAVHAHMLPSGRHHGLVQISHHSLKPRPHKRSIRSLPKSSWKRLKPQRTRVHACNPYCELVHESNMLQFMQVAILSLALSLRSPGWLKFCAFASTSWKKSQTHVLVESHTQHCPTHSIALQAESVWMPTHPCHTLLLHTCGLCRYKFFLDCLPQSTCVWAPFFPFWMGKPRFHFGARIELSLIWKGHTNP